MKILIIAAHPDDIEPQMGGTIAKYVNNGDKVLMLNIVKYREEEAIKSAKILGADIKILDESKDNLCFNMNLVSKIEDIIKGFNPDRIYTCFPYDSHQDHQVVARAVFAAARYIKCDIYMFESILPGGIVPEKFKAMLYVDISDFIQKKIDSIKAYKSSDIKYKNWIEASIGRSRLRGFEMGVDYAEAFQVVRKIE